MAVVPGNLILAFVGQDLIGDGVMKLPFLQALRESYPSARILWVAAGKSVFATTLRPLTRPLLDEVIEDTGIGASWLDIVRPAFALPCADLLLDTQRHVPTSLALRRLRPRHFISAAAGWRLSSLRPAERDKPPAMLRQMFRLLEACGALPDLARLPPLMLPALFEAEAMQRLPPGPLLVGLAPGAGGRHKCWPLDNYLALGQALARRGFRPVVLLGPDEQQWRPRVVDALPEALLPIGADDSPLMTMALARRLSVAVANDSGAGHLLAAAGASLVSLFGPTDPNKFAPASPNLVVIRAQEFGASAMAAIPVAAVCARLLEALAAGSGNRS